MADGDRSPSLHHRGSWEAGRARSSRIALASLQCVRNEMGGQGGVRFDTVQSQYAEPFGVGRRVRADHGRAPSPPSPQWRLRSCCPGDPRANESFFGH